MLYTPKWPGKLQYSRRDPNKETGRLVEEGGKDFAGTRI
jgi:hypothetical protein